MKTNHFHIGEALAVLRTFPDCSVNTCITSPPYWGLRDYGHSDQLGLEETPEEYTVRLVEIFREVRRVLMDDGTLWLNLGDSYGAIGGDTYTDFNMRYSGTGGNGSKQNKMLSGAKDLQVNSGLRPKNLIGIPWRVAFALQADGWYLRQDIIWHKPNPMPESVRDRCTKSHEYIFLLSKSARYYYDQEAIKEEAISPGVRVSTPYGNADTGQQSTTPYGEIKNSLKNKRSVWTVATQPYYGAHFAVYPPKLIEPCILAGCPQDGVVLDPFMGSGTTAMVARRNGRNFVGIELNPDNVKLANERLTQDMGMFSFTG